MNLTITISEPLATRLQDYAATSRRSADEAVAMLLAVALPVAPATDAKVGTADDSLLRLVERIQATPPNPKNVFSEADLQASSQRFMAYLAASIAKEDRNEPFDEQKLRHT